MDSANFEIVQKDKDSHKFYDLYFWYMLMKVKEGRSNSRLNVKKKKEKEP